MRALDAELAEEEATEIATWFFMVAGRRDPRHAYHAYLASLPNATDDVACWPKAMWEKPCMAGQPELPIG